MSTTFSDVGPDSIRDKVSAVIASENVTLDSMLGADVTGQGRPVVVISPSDEQQVSDVLRMANEAGWRTLPFGGRTHMGVADVPDTVDIAISTRHMNQIVDYSPADMVVTAQAGLRLSELQKELASYRQMLPIDPVCNEHSTIGGATAVGASGPMQFHYGAIRDMTVGMRVVYPDGRMIKTGSRVVKNVAGYDMTKLFVGSYGTLAFFSEVSFKLRPSPLYQTLVVAAGGPEESREYVRRIVHSRLVPSRVEALIGPYPFLPDGDKDWHIAVDCHENRLAGEFQARALTDIARDLGMSSATHDEGTEQFWAQYHETLRPSTLIVRYVLRPVSIMTISQRIRDQLNKVSSPVQLSVSAPRGVGRVYAKDFSPDLELEVVRTIRQIAEEHGGFAAIENGSPAVRSQINAFGAERRDFRLMQGIKRSIDPHGIMNRGRLRGIETWGKANLKS